MCGIAGIVDFRSAEVPEQELIALRESIAHRGPDDAGIYRAPGVGLAARRLAILDLSQSGHMPMPNDDESLWITYNGEVYNFVELRSQLEDLGHRFRSNSDTEVVLRAFEEWGDSCVERMVGMFAFAIWDCRRRRLFGARDRLGVKPFFYGVVDSRFVFASEVHGLYRFIRPDVGRIDPLALDFYLGFGYLPPKSCLVRGLHKLPAAHTLSVERGELHQRRYWRPHYRPTRVLSLGETLEALDAQLREAVSRRLRSDVPLGCFLSGGIDSGLVAAMAAEASPGRLKTFSVGFSGAAPDQDERPLAKLVSERYGTDHAELLVQADQKSILPRILWHVGEPFADIGILPMFQISEQARAAITVALSGDGGDESFVGYPNIRSAHLAARLRNLLPLPLRRTLTAVLGLGPIAASVPGARRARRWLKYYVNRPVPEQFDSAGSWNAAWRSRLYAPQASVTFGTESALDVVRAVLEEADPLLSEGEAHLFTDLHLRLSKYLTKVDIASNMVSLEVRSPFLDHELVELAATLPLKQKLLGGRQKGLLRQLARRYLPATLIEQPKRGFAPPVGKWLRTDWADLIRELTSDAATVRAGLFQEPVLSQVVNAHISGRVDHAARIYTFLCLELWWRLFVDGTLSKDDTL